MEEKSKKFTFLDKNISPNVDLIRLILGEVFLPLEEQIKDELIQKIKYKYWYQKIMEEGIECTDFWQR